MKKELVLKKCLKCGAVVEIINDCNCNDCGIKCCDQNMQTVKPNTIDASFEKHIPTYKVDVNKITVNVNHVMEEDHYISWIALVTHDKLYKVILKPGDDATCEFDYIKGSTIYSYCNKHGLWEITVE